MNSLIISFRHVEKRKNNEMAKKIKYSKGQIVVDEEISQRKK